MDQKISLGQLITYNTLLVYFTNPLENIINLQTKLQSARVANERLNEVYLVKSEFEEEKLIKDLSHLQADIDFRGVSYKYGYGANVLSEIDLHIPAGSKTSFVGVSGSGKTTLAKIMVRIKGIFVWEESISISWISRRCANISTIFPSNRMFLMELFWKIYS